MQSTMMNFPLTLAHILGRAGKLFGASEIVSRLPDKSLHRHHYRDFHRRALALGGALQAAGLQEGRPRRHADVEPLRASGGLFRHPVRGRRAAYAQPAPASRRYRVHRAACRRPLPHRRRRAAAVVRKIPRQGQLRARDRRAAHRQPGCRRLRRLRTLHRRRRRDDGSARSTKTMPRACATRPARRASPKVSFTRTARSCCTRWPARWATRSA